MKVKELISKLSEYNQELDVEVMGEYFGTSVEIEDVGIKFDCLFDKEIVLIYFEECGT